MAGEVTFRVGDRVWLKPSGVEGAMLGTIANVRIVAGDRAYDVSTQDHGEWAGWYADRLTYADLPPSTLKREELELWLTTTTP